MDRGKSLQNFKIIVYIYIIIINIIYNKILYNQTLLKLTDGGGMFNHSARYLTLCWSSYL